MLQVSLLIIPPYVQFAMEPPISMLLFPPTTLAQALLTATKLETRLDLVFKTLL